MYHFNFIKKVLILLSIWLFVSKTVIIILRTHHFILTKRAENIRLTTESHIKKVTDLSNKIIYDIEAIKNMSFLFIGGYQRSGTTLIRAMLDVHRGISCGAETKILPEFLKAIKQYKKKEKLNYTETHLDNALRLYIYSLLTQHNTKQSVEYLCAKDPNILLYMTELVNLFPNSRFIYMVRDVRAVVYSLLKHYERTNDYQGHFSDWELYNENVNFLCESHNCAKIHYEKLVLKPKNTMQRLVRFLRLNWTEDFLKHHLFVGKNVSISSMEWSSDQIKRPIYTDSLTEWVNHTHYDNNIFSFRVHMLFVFGYDVNKNNYNYLL